MLRDGFWNLDRGEGIPWKGNYSSWLDQKAKRLAQESKNKLQKDRKPLERELRMGTARCERTPGKAKSTFKEL